MRAVVSHEGPDRRSGHFKSFIKSDNKAWYCADDETVRITSWDTVSKTSAYILVYQKVGDKHTLEQTRRSKADIEKRTSKIETIVKQQTD